MTVPPQLPSVLTLRGPVGDGEVGTTLRVGATAAVVVVVSRPPVGAGTDGGPAAVPSAQYTAPVTRVEQLVTKGLDRRNCVTVIPANSASEAQVSPDLAVTGRVQLSARWARTDPARAHTRATRPCLVKVDDTMVTESVCQRVSDTRRDQSGTGAMTGAQGGCPRPFMRGKRTGSAGGEKLSLRH